MDRALLLFAGEDASVNVEAARARLERLSAQASARLEGVEGARSRVQALNRFFFVERGFGSDPDLGDRSNLFPDRVLERRRGYCTGLALVYASVARRLELPVHGVSTPSHLFLRYDDGAERINIETLEDGREISDETYRRRDAIQEVSVERGVFLANLDDDRFLSQLVNNLGTLRSRAGDLERARKLYRRALDLDPRNVTAVFNLARDRMRQERFREAADGFTHALELHPAHVAALNNRGVCLLRLGDRDGAVADFLHALSLDPDFAEARRNLELVAPAPGS
jgi:regulator of sirC expression with transglutaminase-like and TPR domain